MSNHERLTNAAGRQVADNINILAAGRRGPLLLRDIWLIEKLAHFDREVMPERRTRAKGWVAHETFTTTQDVTKYTKAHFKEDIVQAFYDGIRHKPETTFGNVKADVLADKDPNFQRINFCSVIRSSAWGS